MSRKSNGYAGGIIAMNPVAYGEKLENEWFMNLYNQEVARDERVRDAEIDLMNAQAEYYRALAKKLESSND